MGTYVETSLSETPPGTMDVRAQLTYLPQPNHNGKALICTANHEMYTSDDLDNKYNEAYVNVSVLGKKNEQEKKQDGAIIDQQLYCRLK